MAIFSPPAHTLFIFLWGMKKAKIKSKSNWKHDIRSQIKDIGEEKNEVHSCSDSDGGQRAGTGS